MRSSWRVLASLTALDREWKVSGKIAPDADHAKLARTRQSVQERWTTVADILETQGESALAADTRHFAKHLPLVRATRERCALGLTETAVAFHHPIRRIVHSR